MAENSSEPEGSGSTARVAWDMTRALAHALPRTEGEATIRTHLDLYAACYNAARGARKTDQFR